MYSFRELQKAAKKEIEGKEMKLAVLGNSATQLLSASIQGYARLEGLNLSVFDAPFDQIDAQLLDPASETRKFAPDEILLYLATERLYEAFLDLPLAERSSFAEGIMNRLVGYYDIIAGNLGARILQCNFTEPLDQVIGQYSAKVDTTFTYQIRKLNALLQETMSTRRDVYPIDLLSIQLQTGSKTFFDPAYYFNTTMTIAPAVLPQVAGAVTGVLKAMEGRVRKCVIFDLDGTVWGGIIGDDGMGGIEIGGLGKGHAFQEMQRYLKELKDYGIILAVCSKNTEEIAREPFERHPEMILRLSDISVFVANWEDKATNIRTIIGTLNIGADSVVFLDDNPFERNLIREMIPGVTVPELPEDPAEYVRFLRESGLFDTASYTGPGEDRTEMYRAEFARKQMQAKAASLDDYLEGLQMIGTAQRFAPEQYARIAQLTQRSNQFNLRTVRYTEGEIARIAEDPEKLPLSFTLQDRFGHHGLVSVLILDLREKGEAFVDTWLMSCRVLKRGMEEYVINSLVRAAKEAGIRTIRGEYLPTAKNGMVRDVYEKMGFTREGEGCYSLQIADFQPLPTHIREEKKA
ncbi:MAG: HAD-IIIC family phosphatase [Lachnospiraceae bacterium]|nr:HAD-IIIC family phosphatase [Lachnospiraceae bacterium]